MLSSNSTSSPASPWCLGVQPRQHEDLAETRQSHLRHTAEVSQHLRPRPTQCQRGCGWGWERLCSLAASFIPLDESCAPKGSTAPPTTSNHRIEKGLSDHGFLLGGRRDAFPRSAARAFLSTSRRHGTHLKAHPAGCRYEGDPNQSRTVINAFPVLSGFRCTPSLSCASRNQHCPFTSARITTSLSVRSASSSSPRGLRPPARAATRRALSSARFARSSTAAFTC
jgi:hypothetical protein